MDLIYKIYSVWLYQDQLKHSYVFFYNRSKSISGQLEWSAPYFMFGSSEFCANTKIYNLDKNDPDFIEKSIELMSQSAKREGILFLDASEFITLSRIEEIEERITYSGALFGEEVEKEGKYKGLKKKIYAAYDIMWNETKSGINPHEYEVMGVWKPGSSQYTTYRIWEEKENRITAIRDYKLNQII
jgi:hypothetical protein